MNQTCPSVLPHDLCHCCYSRQTSQVCWSIENRCLCRWAKRGVQLEGRGTKHWHHEKQGSSACRSPMGQGLCWDTSRDNIFSQTKAARTANLSPQASSFHLPTLSWKTQFCTDHCEAWSQFWKTSPDAPCEGTRAHSNHQLLPSICSD